MAVVIPIQNKINKTSEFRYNAALGIEMVNLQLFSHWKSVLSLLWNSLSSTELITERPSQYFLLIYSNGFSKFVGFSLYLLVVSYLIQQFPDNAVPASRDRISRPIHVIRDQSQSVLEPSPGCHSGQQIYAESFEPCIALKIPAFFYHYVGFFLLSRW